MIRIATLTAAITMASGSAFAAGDAAEGEKAFNRCKSCHMIANGDDVIVKGGKTGPNLYGVIGRTAGADADFTKYGDSLIAAGEAGLVWDEEQLAIYVVDPKKYLQDYLDDSKARSKMSFKLKNGGEDVAAYLASVAE